MVHVAMHHPVYKHQNGGGGCQPFLIPPNFFHGNPALGSFLGKSKISFTPNLKLPSLFSKQRWLDKDFFRKKTQTHFKEAIFSSFSSHFFDICEGEGDRHTLDNLPPPPREKTNLKSSFFGATMNSCFPKKYISGTYALIPTILTTEAREIAEITFEMKILLLCYSNKLCNVLESMKTNFTMNPL